MSLDLTQPPFLGAVRLMSDEPATVDVVSTGILDLDALLGIGGYPVGRIIEVFGPHLVTSRDIAYAAIGACQKAGGTAAYIDVAHAFDVPRSFAHGVDLGRMLLAQPDNGEQAIDIIEALIRSGAVSLLIVDAVSALVPLDALEYDDASPVGALPRMMSKAMRKLCTLAPRAGCTVVFLNTTHSRDLGYGPVATTDGGNALKYYASIRIEVKPINGWIGAKVVKNKFAPPFRSCLLPVLPPE